MDMETTVILGTPHISLNLGLTGWLIIISIAAIGMAFHYRSKWLQLQAQLHDLEDQTETDTPC